MRSSNAVASDDSYKVRARVWGWEVSAAEVVFAEAGQPEPGIKACMGCFEDDTRSSMEEAEVAGVMIFGDGGGLAGDGRQRVRS